MMMMRAMMEMKEFSFFPTQKAKCGRQAWTPTGTFDVEQGYVDDVGMNLIVIIMMMMMFRWWWLDPNDGQFFRAMEWLMFF